LRHADAYRRTTTWLNTADYIAYKLSGVAATDYSLASRTLALDLRRRWTRSRMRCTGAGWCSFLPHLRTANAPHNDAQAMGAFIGLTTDARRGALFRALLEGIAFEMRGAREPLVNVTGVQPDQIVAAGGARNALLMQIKADVFRTPIIIRGDEEATALGAAMLGGVAACVYPNAADAARSLRVTSNTVFPDPAGATFYDRAYRDVYQHLYPALKPIHHAARKLHNRT
jgi:xylulokinase